MTETARSQLNGPRTTVGGTERSAKDPGPAAAEKRLRVIYIGGAPRSGSTVLAQLLGECRGVTNLGEACRFISSKEFLSQDLPCSCGSSVRSCNFWRPLIPHIDARVQARSSRAIRLRHLPRLLVAHRGGGDVVDQAARQLAHVLQQAADAAGSRTLVDSSGHPATAWLLSQCPGIDVSLVQLIRDPRAVVASTRRRNAYLPPASIGTTVATWVSFNIGLELLRDRVTTFSRVIYEDFVGNPTETLYRLVDAGSAERVVGQLSDSDRVWLGSQHHLAGNPGKRSEAYVSLARREWALSRVASATVLAATAPLMLRYGYHLHPTKTVV